jgi:hypothetical protein
VTADERRSAARRSRFFADLLALLFLGVFCAVGVVWALGWPVWR